MIPLLRRHFAPGFIYISGIISLFILDIIITSKMSPEYASEWASIKSFMMISGPLMILGLNNFFIRYPDRIISGLFTSGICLIFSTIAMFIFLSIFLKNKFPPSYAFIASAYALTIVLMSLLRGQMKIIAAQVVQGLWKIVLMLLVSGIVFLKVPFNGMAVLVIFSLLSSSFVGGMGIFKSGKNLLEVGKTNFFMKNHEWFFSLKYLVSVVTAAASAYIEILVLSYFCRPEEVASYFAHYTVFTSVAVIFSGYVGFVLTPAIKKSPKMYLELIFSFKIKYIYYGIIVFLLSMFFGEVFFKIFYDNQYIYSRFFSIAFCICSLIRVVYVLPTAVMGALARSEELNQFVLCGIVGLGLMAIIIYLGYLNGNIIVFIVLGSLGNWLWRTALAYKYARKIQILG